MQSSIFYHLLLMCHRLKGLSHTLPLAARVPKRKAETTSAENKITRPADDTAPFSALAFKVASHPTVDKLVYCRVYSGILRRGEAIYNVRSEKTRAS